MKAVNCQQDDSVDNYNLYEVKSLNRLLFQVGTVYTCKKWTVKKNCYRNIQLPGGFASFPGAREVSSISGSLPDDPGGITCMKSLYQSTKGWLCPNSSRCNNVLIGIETDFDPGNEISVFLSFSPSARRPRILAFQAF